MQIKTRLETLWNFIDENLEVDYGYLPMSNIDDDACVDDYIQEIKDDFEQMREKGWIKKESIQKSIDLLKSLDDI